MPSSTPVAALERAVQLAGGQSAFADALSARRNEPITPARVWNWLKRDMKAPTDYCPDIEALWGIPCEDLAPSVDWAVVRNTAANAAGDDSLQGVVAVGAMGEAHGAECAKP